MRNYREVRLLKRVLKGYPLRDLLPYLVDYFCQKLRQFVYTRITRILALWWGIKLGKSSKFFGVPIMHKHPTGTIHIGNNAIFRSGEWSNSIGLNRRCVLSVSRDAEIIIGNDCGFSATVIAASDSIIIGDRVMCGANCTIADTDRHPVDPIDRATHRQAKSKPVVIEDDVWLGLNVVVSKGCHIGCGTTVAANSVVVHSLPEDVIAGGVPAHVLRKLQP